MSSTWVPVSLWLIGQMMTLSIGASRTALTARAGDLPRQMALPEMIVVQLSLSVLLFPAIGRRGTFIFAACTAVIFLDLAGWLSGTGAGAMLWTIADVGAWLAALALIARDVRSPLLVAVVRMVLTLLVIGLPIALFFIDDFADVPIDSRFVDWLDLAHQIVLQTHTSRPVASPLALSVALLSVGLLGRFAKRNSRNSEIIVESRE